MGHKIAACFHENGELMTCCNKTNLQRLNDSITSGFEKFTEQTGRDLKFIGTNTNRNLQGTIIFIHTEAFARN